jgi:transposase
MSDIDIDATIKVLRQSLEQEKGMSPSLRALIEVLMMVVHLLVNRLGLNSQNSSKPPSSDIDSHKPTRKASGKKTGGQKGRVATTLRQVEAPDEITSLSIVRRSLPKGHRYTEAGVEKRQVIDINFCPVVTEYQAQVLIDEHGKRYVAPFPEGITKAVQYGNTLKAHAVYLSQYQLLPYKRVAEYFSQQCHIHLSKGSIANFNKQAFTQLSVFTKIVKQQLSQSACIHVDETGVNINGKRHWLHSASNDSWTAFSAHAKRGVEAMNEADILPHFKGVLCHVSAGEDPLLFAEV